MKALRKINLIVVGALGLTAGIPKVMRMPQEVEFFETTGLGAGSLLAFGLVQLLGGVLLVVPKTRRVGAMVVATTFLVSTVMLFMSGQMVFGAVSAASVLMAGFVVRDGRSAPSAE